MTEAYRSDKTTGAYWWGEITGSNRRKAQAWVNQRLVTDRADVFEHEVTSAEALRGVRIPFGDFVKLHVYSENWRQIPRPNAVERELQPLVHLLTDTISGEQVPHFIRASSVADILAGQERVVPSQRSRLKYILTYDHSYEFWHNMSPGSYADRVRRKLQEGPDLDLVLEMEPEALGSRIIDNIESYYLQDHGESEGGRSGRYVKARHEERTPDASDVVWEAMNSRLRAFSHTYNNPHADNDVYVRLQHGKRRSGVPYTDIGLYTAPGGLRVDKNRLQYMDPVFLIGISQFETLPDDLRQKNLRLGPASSSWDRKGKAIFDGTDIVVPADSVRTLTSPIEVGEGIVDLPPVQFFEESLRIMRKGLTYEKNLYLSEEGRKHLNTSSFLNEYGYSTAIADRTFSLLRSRLTNNDFKSMFYEQLTALPEEKREYVRSKIAAEVMTMIFQTPQKAFALIRDVGLKEYFPEMRNISDENWDEIVKQLPEQRAYELSLALRMTGAYHQKDYEVGRALITQNESIYRTVRNVLYGEPKGNFFFHPKPDAIEKCAQLCSVL